MTRYGKKLRYKHLSSINKFNIVIVKLTKISLVMIFMITASNCSFDNKTGIWKNVNEVNLGKTKKFEGFETLYTKKKNSKKLSSQLMI